MTKDNNIQMRKSRLTCISIEPIGQINTKHGNLIRYLARFLEGIEGEYWAKYESSTKNFPLNEAHWYKYEPLTKKGMAETWKFQPCKKSEIPEVSDPLPNSATPPVAPKTAHAMAVAPAPSPDGIRPPASGAPPPVHLEAFRSALRLALTGRIAVDQIKVTARELKNVITELSKES